MMGCECECVGDVLVLNKQRFAFFCTDCRSDVQHALLWHCKLWLVGTGAKQDI